MGVHQAAAREAALRLAKRIHEDDRVSLVARPELDIVCIKGPGDAVKAFDALAEDGFHVATLRTGDGTTALRCCLLKREHLAIVDDLADALIAALS
jgi:glutamate/tyrosine decarboxylase-like PLP-dependent enzyme